MLSDSTEKLGALLQEAVSVSPLSPSVAPDSIHFSLPTHRTSDLDPELHHRQRSMPDRTIRVHELPASKDVKDCAGLPEVVPAAGSDIPPDSPIRSMYVVCAHLFEYWEHVPSLRHHLIQLFTVYNQITPRVGPGQVSK